MDTSQCKMYPLQPIVYETGAVLIPALKFVTPQDVLVAEVYSLYSGGLHWVTSVCAKVFAGKVDILDVWHLETPLTEQEFIEYTQAFSVGEGMVGEFVPAEGEPFQLTFIVNKLLLELTDGTDKG